MSEFTERRRFLGDMVKFIGAVGVATLAHKPVIQFGTLIIENLVDGQNDLPDYLLSQNVVSVDSEAARSYWGEIYTVRYGDTISKIAATVYPDFDSNQPFYTNKLRFANRQDKRQNLLIYPGQDLYIPNPGVPILGFAEGEEAVLKGQMIEGVYLPTKITEVNPKNNRLGVSYCNGFIETSLKIGGQFATGRSLRIVTVLKELPGLVPSRVVFELVN